MYSPGDRVSLKVSSSHMIGGTFASICVTDVSSLLKVPKYKHQPSLPSMVYLEKEALDENMRLDEFWYS